MGARCWKDTHRHSFETSLVESLANQLDPNWLVIFEIQQGANSLKLCFQFDFAFALQFVVVLQQGVHSVQGQSDGPNSIVHIAIEFVLLDGDVHLASSSLVLFGVFVCKLGCNGMQISVRIASLEFARVEQTTYGQGTHKSGDSSALRASYWSYVREYVAVHCNQ